MRKERKTTPEEQEALKHLNTLHATGKNAFGLVTPLRAKFGITEKEANRIHILWQTNFNTKGNYNTVLVN